MSGKVKSLYGLYRTLGKDAFLFASQKYTSCENETVEKRIAHMEGTWSDEQFEITEADRMVQDFQSGYLSKESILEEMESSINFYEEMIL